MHLLGLLCADQGKLGEAEQMYERARRGREEALGPAHTSTLDTVNNLGNLYADQGKRGEAERMYERALRGYEQALGHEQAQQYRPALDTLQNLGGLYVEQAETDKAQTMYSREHNRFPVPAPSLFSPQGPNSLGLTSTVLALLRGRLS
jgi:tetratricopeptide (TPR) repeat protein